jgi:hypothetical protein
MIKAAGEAQENAYAEHVAVAVGEPLQLADVPMTEQDSNPEN